MDTICSVEELSCPITLQIFLHPVTADDGQTYEKSALKKWLINNNTSPVTKKPIKSYSRSIFIENIIGKYLEQYPENKKYQYIDEPELYSSCLEEIIDILKNKQWNKLKKYAKIDLKHLFENINFNNIGNIPNDIMMYLIDNSISLEYQENDSWRPIHYICRYSTPEIIKYIIDKGVDLECSNKDGWRPIHFICRYSTPEMIKYIINKGVDLECCDKGGWRPIHLICRYSTPEMIKYIIDKGVDLECSKKDGWRPIHIICRYSTQEMIKYIIDKGVDITATIKNRDNKDVTGFESTILYLLKKNENEGVKDYLEELMKQDRFINLPLQ